MSCEWGIKDCKHDGTLKCTLCTTNGYHYETKYKVKNTTIKAKETGRMGSLFEARNHINNAEMIQATTRMTPNSGAGKVKGENFSPYVCNEHRKIV